jgi:hypothetical protein
LRVSASVAFGGHRTRKARAFDVRFATPATTRAGLLTARLAKRFHNGYPMKGKCESWPMTPSNVHVLHPTSPPLAGYLRVGHTGHHKLEALHAADRPGFSRLVVDAANAVGQADFLGAQPAAGREIVIDLNVAETAIRPGSGGMAVIRGGRP